MPRRPGLDTLRALAILWVMLFHAWAAGLGTPSVAVARFGWMGVDLFFVLSGYLIGWQWLKPYAQGRAPSFADFYWRRAWRILPAFWVVLLLYTALPVFREAPGMQPLWQFATFTVNFQIDYFHNKAFSHAWSLCVEEHFYLLFPLLAALLMRRPSLGKTVALAACVVGGGLLLRAGIWHYGLAPLTRAPVEGGFGQHFIQDIYYPSYTRLDGLLAGVLLAALRAFRPMLWQRILSQANALLLSGLVCVAGAIALFQERTGFLATVFGYPLLSLGLAFLVAAGASTQGWLGRTRIPGAGALALMSFSLYLSHKASFHLIETAFGPRLENQGALAFLAYAGAALAAGSLLYVLVERPGLRLRERWRQGALELPGAERQMTS